MGNAESTGTTARQTELKSWALSQHMHLNHDQLLDLRDECLRATSAAPTTTLSSSTSSLDIRIPSQHEASRAVLSRKELKWALNQVLLGGDSNPDEEQSTEAIEFYTHRRRVILKKDYDVILDLYTIWDMFGTEQVPTLNFVTSLSILACQEDDSLRSFLQLALDVYDVQESGTVTGDDLIKILQSVNSTTAMFGDVSLSQSQVHELVHDVVESASRLGANRPRRRTALSKSSTSHHSQKWMHTDVVTILAGQPMIRKIMTQKPDSSTLKQTRRVSFSPGTKYYSSDPEGATRLLETGGLSASFSPLLHSDDDDGDDQPMTLTNTTTIPNKRILRVRFAPETKDPSDRQTTPSPPFDDTPNMDLPHLEFEYDDDDISTCLSSSAGSGSVGYSNLVWPSPESWDDLKSLAMDSITGGVSGFTPFYYDQQQQLDRPNNDRDEVEEAFSSHQP